MTCSQKHRGNLLDLFYKEPTRWAYTFQVEQTSTFIPREGDGPQHTHKVAKKPHCMSIDLVFQVLTVQPSVVVILITSLERNCALNCVQYLTLFLLCGFLAVSMSVCMVAKWKYTSDPLPFTELCMS